MEYTSHSVGTAALTTGIIGTALGALNNMGGLSGILGGTTTQRSVDDGDRPVTRYELNLIREAAAKDNEIAMLKAQQYANNLAAGIQAEIGQQAVWNATEHGIMGNLQNQIAQLQAMTKLVIPSANVSPSTTATSGN